MAPKLSPKQQQQLVWLDTLPRKFEVMKKTIELLSIQQADEAQVRTLARICDELKSQGSQLNIAALADGFGHMAMLARRSGGQQIKVRGLREMLAGAKINFEGAYREASMPEPGQAPDKPDVSP